MKKLILVLAVFLLSACNVDYNLEFDDGVFKEEIKVVRETSAEDSFSGRYQIDDNEEYKIDFKTVDNMEHITASYTYKNISFEKSPVLTCFDNKRFEEKDGAYSINLWNFRVACPYLQGAKVTFKTQHEVLSSNAQKIDKEKGIYEWNTLEKGINIQISGKKVSQKKSLLNNSIFIRIVLLGASVIAGVIIIVISMKRKER